MERLYKHYKGRIYVILTVATHTETNEKLVVYHPIREPDKMWVRPLSMWNEEVEPGVKRFEPADLVTIIKNSPYFLNPSELKCSFTPDEQLEEQARAMLLGGLDGRTQENGSGDGVEGS